MKLSQEEKAKKILHEEQQHHLEEVQVYKEAAKNIEKDRIKKLEEEQAIQEQKNEERA